tara:strand:- start:50 stop:295 length:246 start_codon:yes stop_codon:yes gene_type:complete
LLNKVLDDWKQPVTDNWKPYSEYEGISLQSSDSDITHFIRNFGKPHKICTMCPTKKDVDSIIDHRSNVISKKQWLKLHHVA